MTTTPKKKKPAQEPEAKKPPSSNSADAKWGKMVMARGFVIIPSILLRAQGRLGLSGTQLAILLQLIDWWMDAKKHPWSKKETLADRIGISERQLQRQVAELEKAGLVRRVEKITNHGKRPNGYDLSGLVARLKALAPEFKAAAKAATDVEKKGGAAAKKAA
ncbi:helix-turn-helix domain-containing protein [Luteibacter aegosomatis]|uniref:helix-turn-helix domain-containing protein n=1 Tax=Luteibacter aegosomatis TaxID=2911537 RepID=UPI001FFB16B3|nr:helix-turn-helix domain-containing protein [Luteibacter aegosomatis]UPG84517.1 helix-turn-helix domain-containing protein [Luteibacter aegosomatis]